MIAFWGHGILSVPLILFCHVRDGAQFFFCNAHKIQIIQNNKADTDNTAKLTEIMVEFVVSSFSHYPVVSFTLYPSAQVLHPVLFPVLQVVQFS